MSYNVREMLKGFSVGLEKVATTHGANVDAFMNLLGASYEPKSLSLKTKELMSIAIGVYSRCDYCIVYHCHKALEAGASKEEILEAAMVAVAFGGGPSMAYTATLLNECLEEFAGDFA